MPDTLAKALFAEDNPTGIWAAEDECTRLHYRRKAQEVRREQIMQELAEQAGLGY
jgi:hypothetical protein